MCHDKRVLSAAPTGAGSLDNVTSKDYLVGPSIGPVVLDSALIANALPCAIDEEAVIACSNASSHETLVARSRQRGFVCHSAARNHGCNIATASGPGEERAARSGGV